MIRLLKRVKFLIVLILYGCGTPNLGDDFYIFDGDKKEDRVLVYCTDKDGNECYSGIPIAPSYDRQFIDGKYAEYLESVNSNNEWLIARTITVDRNHTNYWVLNKEIKSDLNNCGNGSCKEIIKSKIYGPLSHSDFINKKQELKIEIGLE